MNRQSSAVSAGVLALILIGWAGWPVDRPRPERAPIPIEGVGGHHWPDGVTVRLTYSSCTELDRIDVAEDPHTVTLGVYMRDVVPCGTAPTTSERLVVPLRAPLGDRVVVDRATGAQLPHEG